MTRALAIFLAATALALGACSHTTETAARRTVPVASMTLDEIRAELAAISQEIDFISLELREDLKRANDQRRMASLIQRNAVDSSVVGSYEPMIVSYRPPVTRLQALHNRRSQLRAQLAARQPQS